MALQTSLTMSADGNSNPIPINHEAENFGVGFGCVVAGGSTLTYKIQHTFDNIYEKTRLGQTIDWFDHASVTGKTTSSDGNYAFPIYALRMVVSGWAAGSVTLTVMQNH